MNNNICILSDTHFGHSSNSEQVLMSSISFFTESLVPFLRKNNINKIFILGDLFDTRTSINVLTQNVVYDLFDTVLKDFDIFITLGNHDIYYNSMNDIHSLKFLRKFENVTLFEKPEVINIKNKDILVVPWLVNEKELSTIFNEYEADVLMGHFDIKGFSFNKHTTSKDGLDSGLFLNRFKSIFSGHFHTRSVRDIGDTKFIYVGTPYQLTRADMGEERGFVIYNLKTHKHKFFSNDVSTKFVNLEYPKTFTEKMIKNNCIDLIIKYDKESYTPDEYSKYINKIEEMKPVSVKPLYIDTTELVENFDIKKCNLSSIPTLMKDFVEAMTINTTDKQEVYKILVDVYDKVGGDKY